MTRAASFPSCPRCWLRACLCAELPNVVTRTRFVILRHAMERCKVSNTGRLAALALSNATLLDYGTRDELPPLGPELAGAWLLYPDGASVPRPDRPERIVVLDGSWPQARRMLQRIPGLARLPRLALPAPAPRRRMRRGLLADGMSTLEAVAAAVALLEGPALARPLDRLYSQAVLRAVAGRERLSPELVTAIRVEPAEAERVQAELTSRPARRSRPAGS